MSEQPKHKDLICAFLDEELSAGDVDELLSQLECQDTRARACRQSLVASLLVGRQNTLCPDLSAGVRAALAQESAGATPTVVPLRRAPGRRRDWKVPATGFALAASMAMVAVFVVKPSSQPAAEATAPARIASAASGQPVAQTVAVSAPATRELVIAAPEHSRPLVAQWGSADAPGTQPVTSSSALQRQQLNTFLINHARNGGGNALSGSLGYARVAASPKQQSDESRR